MSRRRIILNVSIVFMSLVGASYLLGMEEHHEEYGQEERHESSKPSPEASVQTGRAMSTATTTGTKLAWENQPGTEKGPGKGITNINESRGNWFFKQQIAKDARTLFSNITKKVSAIQPLQEKYINDYASIDEVFNKFNREYGFQGGDIDARLDILLEEILKLEQTESAHDEEEKVLLEDLKKKKSEIDALKKDFDHLQVLDNSLSKGLSDMSSQITKATTYEDQASEHYEAIYEVLSDQAAEELLKKMQVIYENITGIETYLTADFSNFFKKTSQDIVNQIEAVKQHIHDLKDQGIALGQKMRDLQAKEEEELKRKEAQEREKQAKIKEKAERTILSPVFDAINWFWGVVRNSVVWVFSKIGNAFSWIFASKTEKKVEKPELHQVPPAPEMIEEPEEEPISPAHPITTPPVTTAPGLTTPTTNIPVVPEQAHLQSNVNQASPVQVQEVPQMPTIPEAHEMQQTPQPRVSQTTVLPEKQLERVTSIPPSPTQMTTPSVTAPISTPPSTQMANLQESHVEPVITAPVITPDNQSAIPVISQQASVNQVPVTTLIESPTGPEVHPEEHAQEHTPEVTHP